MIDPFAKGNRLSGRLNACAGREIRLLDILSLIVFLLGSFAVFDFSYDLCNIIGSIVSGTPSQALWQLLRKLPNILLTVLTVWLAGSFHGLRYVRDGHERVRKWVRQGTVCVAFGLAVIVYVPIGLAMGVYRTLLENYPSLLFPLNTMLFGAIAVLFGLFSVKRSRRLNGAESDLPDCGKVRVGAFCTVFRTIGYLLTLIGFSVCIHGLYIIDYSHGDVFFNLVLWLNFLSPVVMTAYWRFVYHDAAPEARPDVQRFGAVAFLLANVLLLGLYMLAGGLQNEAPNQNAFGVLPVEFTASVHAFLLLYGTNNLLMPLSALLRSRKDRRT